MRLAYLILAHKSPAQIDRMIRALRGPGVQFFIHLDLKSDDSEFGQLARQEDVTFITKRVSVQWATYSLVQATINGLQQIDESGDFDYVTLMSGQDFPLVSATEISSFFHRNAGTEFIKCEPYNAQDPWWKDAEKRFHHFNLQNLKLPGKYRLEALLARVLPKRNVPMGYTIAGNSQWFSITGACNRYILDFLEKNPRMARYFYYVWGADEFIFATIVYNSSFASKVKDNLVFVEWPAVHSGHPTTFGESDFEKLKKSGKLFARKFDQAHDAVILDRLEQSIG